MVCCSLVSSILLSWLLSVLSASLRWLSAFQVWTLSHLILNGSEGTLGLFLKSLFCSLRPSKTTFGMRNPMPLMRKWNRLHALPTLMASFPLFRKAIGRWFVAWHHRYSFMAMMLHCCR
jgi:hypothetical protein